MKDYIDICEDVCLDPDAIANTIQEREDNVRNITKEVKD